MSAKVAHGMRYRHEMDASRMKRAAMLEHDRDARSAKLALRDVERSAPTPHAPDARSARRGRAEAARTVHSARVPRDDGADAIVEIVVGDVTRQRVDAIVNPSNRGLFGTAGVDGAVHAGGGPELTAACRAIGAIDHGQAVVTPGFRLPATHVIHTTTPRWKGGDAGELTMLARAYAASLDAARRLRAHTLAIPAIGTGAFGYPLDRATAVAVETVVAALTTHDAPAVVRFVVLDESLAATYARALDAALPEAVPA
jgi:O-acetyl-ADP-ribose deacetylase